MALPKRSVDDMYNWYPCYDINLAFEDPNFRGDAIDVLNYENCPIADRFWVMARPEMVPDENILHQFGLDLMANFSPTASMSSALLQKAQWMTGALTDEALQVFIDSEQVNLDALKIENNQVHSDYGLQALSGNLDDSAVLAHDLVYNTQKAGVNVLDIDPRTASYKALVPLITVSDSIAEWSRLHMIELLEG